MDNIREKKLFKMFCNYFYNLNNILRILIFSDVIKKNNNLKRWGFDNYYNKNKASLIINLNVYNLKLMFIYVVIFKSFYVGILCSV